MVGRECTGPAALAVARRSSDDAAMGMPQTGLLASILLVSVGAAVGGVLRWLLGLGLNALFPALPPGTLAANLVGGYLMGILIALLAVPSAWGPELRLLLVTGLLGGLTTFSSFSGEIARLLQAGRIGMAGLGVGLHVVGSVALTLAGMATVALIRRGA
jgi:fluoride exporter